MNHEQTAVWGRLAMIHTMASMYQLEAVNADYDSLILRTISTEATSRFFQQSTQLRHSDSSNNQSGNASWIL